jgi:hypothetical protein
MEVHRHRQHHANLRRNSEQQRICNPVSSTQHPNGKAPQASMQQLTAKPASHPQPHSKLRNLRVQVRIEIDDLKVSQRPQMRPNQPLA